MGPGNRFGLAEAPRTWLACLEELRAALIAAPAPSDGGSRSALEVVGNYVDNALYGTPSAPTTVQSPLPEAQGAGTGTPTGQPTAAGPGEADRDPGSTTAPPRN